jgi:hypothetical protein
VRSKIKKAKVDKWWIPLGFDSKEEVYFSWWLDELKEAGYVKSYVRQSPTFELSETVQKTVIKELKTKTKEVKQTLLQPCTYTPDFTIQFPSKVIGLCFSSSDKRMLYYNGTEYDEKLSIYDRLYTVYVDIKPLFSIRDSDKAKFSVLQKWVYQKHSVYVNPVVYQKLFEKTFTPARYLLTDKGGQQRKINWQVRTLQEFINRTNDLNTNCDRGG